MRVLNHCLHGMSHLLTGWVTQNQQVFESALNWVLTTVTWRDGSCQNTRATVHRLNLLEVFFQRTLGGWIFLHVKEVWLHVSSWNCVCKYMEKEKTSTGSTLGEWLRSCWHNRMTFPWQGTVGNSVIAGFPIYFLYHDLHLQTSGLLRMLEKRLAVSEYALAHSQAVLFTVPLSWARLGSCLTLQ